MEGFSLAIPFFNEEHVLARTLEEVDKCVRDLGEPYEVILADDGSTDRSRDVAEAFLRGKGKSYRLVFNETNRGRGSVLTKAFASAQMPVVAYIDCDLEIGLHHLRDLLHSFRDSNVSVCTGSKVLGAAGRSRPGHRHVATLVLNYLFRRILNSTVSDHQCGLKGFRKELIHKLLLLAKEAGWAWDTEMLLLAQQHGCQVHEIPVELHHRRRSKVRYLSTTLLFLRKMIEFRYRGLYIRENSLTSGSFTHGRGVDPSSHSKK